MTVFTRTWNAAYENVPADSDQISEGALRIRQGREDVRERGEVDHSWAGDAEDGTHLKVSFTDPLGAKPTQENDQTYLYTKDVSGTSELFFEDESGNEVQLTGGGVTTTFASGTKMVFYQDSAPTGWTIDAALDEHSIRLTDGVTVNGGTAGGTNNFSTQFALLAESATPGVGDLTLTAAQSGARAHTHPAHGHDLLTNYTAGGNSRTYVEIDSQSGKSSTEVYETNNNIGSPFVQQTATPASTGLGATAAHSHTVDLRVKWAACIVATKD